MDHKHDGPKHDLGKKTVAGYGVAVTQVGDQVRAGKAASFEIKLSRDRNSTVGRPRSVRAWLGNERGDGVAKEKAPWRSKEKFYDADIQAPGRIPADTIRFEGATVRFDDAGTCAEAAGRIQLSVAAPIAGLDLSQGLSGPLRCAGGRAQAALASQSGMERLTLAFDGKGAYRAEFAINVDRDPAMGVDRLTSALLDFGGGRQVSFTVSTQSVPFQRVQVVGTTGRIELFIPFNAARGGQMRLALDEGGALDGSGVTVETLPAAEQYRLEVEAFSSRVRAGTPPDASGLDEAVAQARVIDALWQSERSERWEAVARG